MHEETDRERRVFGRVLGRIVPFMFLCYVVAYLDRVNIGFAAADMQRDLGMSDAVYGLGAGLFFFGYFLFEVPSNLILERVGARLWMARIMVVWGLVSMAMMFVVGEWSFYALRVLLGLAEAGFFPGMILYLTYWVPARQRAKAGALCMMAAPVAMVIGAPLSEGLLKLDGRLGLHGWQWLFLLEGLPAVVLGAVALYYLTDRPEGASWLPQEDREWLSREMERERAERMAHQHGSAFASLRSPKEGFKLSAITAIPFVVALVGMVLIGRHSDRTGERKKHVAACAGTASLGLVLAALAGNNVPAIVLSFTLSQLGQRSVQGVFWAIPPLFLGGTAAAAGIALINAVGNLGGFFGPSLMGFLRERSEGYSAGLLVLAAALATQALLVLSLRLPASTPREGAKFP
jgi:ACS family tartrate transporter-like MFS transporter